MLEPSPMNGLFKEPLQERAATEGSRKAESDRQTPPSKSRPSTHQANKEGSWKITWTNLFYIEKERFCLKLQKEGEFIGAEGLRRPTQRCAAVLRANVCIFHQHSETKSCSEAKKINSDLPGGPIIFSTSNFIMMKSRRRRFRQLKRRNTGS